jgi:hypothetical protein
MFKKIIAASAVLALFACSSGDDGFVNPSSSSEQGSSNGDSSSGGTSGDNSSSSNISDEGSSSSIAGEDSSSSVASVIPVQIVGTTKQSQIFKTYYYGYTLKANSPEDLEQFWDVQDTVNCPTAKQTTKPPATCQLDSTETILRNKLTNQDAALHYDIPFTRLSTTRGYAELKEYILKEDGDQAALGLNVYTDDNNPKNIGELGKSELDGVIAFAYRYAGGAHIFRLVSKKDSDFWYKEVPATPSKTDTATIKIQTSELAGTGSLATFDISKVAKFLWVVEYDSATTSKNEGSLRIENLNAEVEQ